MTILVVPLRTAMVLTVVAGGRAVRSIPPAVVLGGGAAACPGVAAGRTDDRK